MTERSFIMAKIAYPTELTDQFTFAETIGEGGFAKVKLGRHKLTKEKVAIKIMDKEKLMKTNDLPRVALEIQALKDLHHQSIAQLLLFHETKDQYYLVLEHAPGGELFDYIVSRQRCKEDEARRFFRQIISAVAYCHERGIAHRDLKPENLLLDKQMNIKLIDFGLIARPADIKADLLKTCCGSAAYAAPELIRGEKYLGEPADMWSLGILLYALLVGWLPFDDDNMQTLYRLIQKGSYEIPAFLSSESVKLIGQLLKHKPTTRLTMVQLLEHPWVLKGSGVSKVIADSKLGDKRGLDKVIVSELAKYYAKDPAVVADEILEWKYDDLTANYKLLLQKKSVGGTIKLPAGKAAIPVDMQANPRSTGGGSEPLRPIGGDGFTSGHMAARLIAGSSVKRTSPELGGSRESKLDVLPPITPLTEDRRSASLGAEVDQVGRDFAQLKVDKEAVRPASNLVTQQVFSGSAAAGLNHTGVEAKAGGSTKKAWNFMGSVRSLWSRESLGPRKIKGLFNVSTTSGKAPDDVLAEVKRILELNEYDVRVKSFLVKARKVDATTGKTMSINFEVCITANLDLTGIRLTRVKGESWEYKQAVTGLLGQMRL